MKRPSDKPPMPRTQTLKDSPASRAPEGSASRRSARVGSDDSQTDPSVVALLSELEHPLKQDIEAVRRIILEADPSIREAVKWNAPSFRTTDFFATVNLRSRDRVQLIFHTGAKVKATATTGLQIADPEGLLEWLSKDRGTVTLGTGEELHARAAALRELVREWIRWL